MRVIKAKGAKPATLIFSGNPECQGVLFMFI